ncbi:hypothetical protein BCR43DRAFT_481893 [Syncephalastrum racemosum]|uniref:SH3 domain-containing protein n=1 Tax=Syncephalastrum racemosum TaxID=13706 RepID=A0A1X2HSW1_SYNRA|nr:hypothetical protein BCR43DRAFT_481893 [Syncephalastrum racemosum]
MKAKALFDCQADDFGELSFTEGDILVEVKASAEEGWYEGRIQHSSRRGLFPYNYVEFLPETPPSTLSSSTWSVIQNENESDTKENKENGRMDPFELAMATPRQPPQVQKSPPQQPQQQQQQQQQQKELLPALNHTPPMAASPRPALAPKPSVVAKPVQLIRPKPSSANKSPVLKQQSSLPLLTSTKTPQDDDDVEEADGYQLVKPSMLRQQGKIIPVIQPSSTPPPPASSSLPSQSHAPKLKPKPAQVNQVLPTKDKTALKPFLGHATSSSSSSSSSPSCASASSLSPPPTSLLNHVPAASNPAPRLPSRPSAARRPRSNARRSPAMTPTSSSTTTSTGTPPASSAFVASSSPPLSRPTLASKSISPRTPTSVSPSKRVQSPFMAAKPTPSLSPPRPSPSTSQAPAVRPKPAQLLNKPSPRLNKTRSASSPQQPPPSLPLRNATNTPHTNAPTLPVRPSAVRARWPPAQQQQEPSLPVDLKPIASASAVLPRTRSQSNGWSAEKKTPPPPPPSRDDARYEALFDTIHDDGIVDAHTAKLIWQRSRVPDETLARIWQQCDPHNAGLLDKMAFIKGMRSIDAFLLAH